MVADPAPVPDSEDWYANLLAKTADRSVLGGMNDMAFRCEHAARAPRRLTVTPPGAKTTGGRQAPDGTGATACAECRPNACRLCPMSGCGVPEGVDGNGAEAVSEWEGLLAGVEDVSGDQPGA